MKHGDQGAARRVEPRVHRSRPARATGLRLPCRAVYYNYRLQVRYLSNHWLIVRAQVHATLLYTKAHLSGPRIFILSHHPISLALARESLSLSFSISITSRQRLRPRVSRTFRSPMTIVMNRTLIQNKRVSEGAREREREKYEE